jgi:RimJ/RimL family protein N-acetyltransferase
VDPLEVRPDHTATVPSLRSTTDGVVTIRPSTPTDTAALVEGRDAEFRRFLGAGALDPRPTGCIIVDGAVVGWVDYDVERPWLEQDEVNVGYNVFAASRGNGYASRAVQLLIHHLALDTSWRTATLLIHPDNQRSLALAHRLRFAARGDLDGNPYWKRTVPPLSYTDGVVTIRRQHVSDIDADLGAKDDEQIDWLWLSGQRDQWEAMTPDERRQHALSGLRANHDAFVTGPKWTFAVDTADTSYVAYVDCDLANEHVPAGEANISYASHPAHRGRGYVSRAVQLMLQFLRDHTGARTAHILIDARNTASLRVAASVGAAEVGRFTDGARRTVVRLVRTV